ncbi:MAG: arylesterase [Candidatus Pacebacteria bacterium]|nr:arylesterase [Candidatus Paceibacterota bacterium]
MKQTFKAMLITFILFAFFGIFWLVTDKQEIVIEEKDLQELKTEKIKIIAFGDSLTAGYDLTNQETYPAQLEQSLQALGYSVMVINAGVSGETSRGNLERANFISNQNPDIVLLGIGGNDALRSLSVSETKNNILSTIAVLNKNPKPPKIFLLKMQAPLNSGFNYKEKFDAIYNDIASETGVTLIPFITEEIYFDTNNKLSDGIHLNKIGYKKVVDNYILPEMIKVLD